MALGDLASSTRRGNAGADQRLLRVRYFAWVREKVGRSEEDLDVPASVGTVAELVSWLKTLGVEYEEAFKRPEVVRAALDQVHVKPAHPLGDAREVAFFPPVTGG